jgi:hypothetical protein
MKRRLIYDWKLAVLLLSFMAPLAPLFILAFARDPGGAGMPPAASGLVSAILAERMSVLFLAHNAARTGAVLYASKLNTRRHVLDSLLSIACLAACLGALWFSAGLPGFICLGLGAAGIIGLWLSAPLRGGLFILHPGCLQYSVFLYPYEGIQAFEIRETYFYLTFSGKRRLMSLNEGEAGAAAISAILSELTEAD